MRPLAALRRYMAAEDPRVATANLIAMVLAWNTPFYPIYVLGTAGAAMQPGAWFTVLSFPVFLAVPAVTRRNPLGGRALLAAAGLANTVYCTWLLGEAAGAQLFLLPCIVLAPMLFRLRESAALCTFLGLPILAGAVLHGNYPVSPMQCMDEACSALRWLNIISVICLLGFLGLLALRRLIQQAKPPLNDGAGLPSTHRPPPPIR